MSATIDCELRKLLNWYCDSRTKERSIEINQNTETNSATNNQDSETYDIEYILEIIIIVIIIIGAIFNTFVNGRRPRIQPYIT